MNNTAIVIYANPNAPKSPINEYNQRVLRRKGNRLGPPSGFRTRVPGTSQDPNAFSQNNIYVKTSMVVPNKTGKASFFVDEETGLIYDPETNKYFQSLNNNREVEPFSATISKRMYNAIQRIKAYIRGNNLASTGIALSKKRKREELQNMSVSKDFTRRIAQILKSREALKSRLNITTNNATRNRLALKLNATENKIKNAIKAERNRLGTNFGLNSYNMSSAAKVYKLLDDLSKYIKSNRSQITITTGLANRVRGGAITPLERNIRTYLNESPLIGKVSAKRALNKWAKKVNIKLPTSAKQVNQFMNNLSKSNAAMYGIKG